MSRPAALATPNPTEVVRACEAYLDMVENGDNDDARDDQMHWIFEAAMAMVYGEDGKVWSYINGRT